MLKGAAVVIVFLVLSGCATKNDIPHQQLPDSTVPPASFSATSTSGENPPSPELPNNGLNLDGCTNGMAVVIYAAKALYPAASSPSDWSSADSDPLLVIKMWLQTCARVSVGPFERGPLHFLVEMHDNMTAPQPCQDVKGDWNFDYALTQFWLDDPEIVDYLRSTYGLPAQFATFAVTQRDVGGGEVKDTWTFGVPGQPSSNLESMMRQADSTEYPTMRLYYFPTPGTVAFMDFATNTRFSGLDSRAVIGQLSPPLLYPSAGVEDIVAYGGPDRDGSFSANFHLFNDTGCTQPA